MTMGKNGEKYFIAFAILKATMNTTTKTLFSQPLPSTVAMIIKEMEASLVVIN
jgi:hypothetical protein